jgi:hypothetical protein
MPDKNKNNFLFFSHGCTLVIYGLSGGVMGRNTIKIPLIIVLFISIGAGAALGGQKIQNIIGDVKFKRDGKAIRVNIGDTLKDGDVIHLGKKSFVELASDANEHMSISGPSVFRVRDSQFSEDASRNGIFANLGNKLSKDVPECRTTTVIGVRGLRGKKSPDTARNKSIEKEAARAAEAHSKGDFETALSIFKKLDSMPDIDERTRANVRFYMADIHFGKMDYSAALGLYAVLYNIDEKVKFRYREISHVRAILCSEYTADSKLRDSLADGYIKKYGTSGAYYSEISKLLERGK